MRGTAVLFALLLSAPAWAYEVKMRVVDETGAPVAGASAAIAFVGPIQSKTVERLGRTGPDGTFSARGETFLQLYLEANKAGHYEARIYRPPPKADLDEVVVLPRILNPVALYAWSARPGRPVPGPQFPLQNEWLGFDFEAADWVVPHGRGKVADIRFRFRNEFKGWKHNERAMVDIRRANAGATEEEFRQFYGKWDAELEISFPCEIEGLYEETTFWHYSQMKMPHQAPEEGYLPTWRYTTNTYSPPTARERVGFFLRTRVKLDEAGTIVSANYAKVVGDFYLLPTGGVKFQYYFNPVPNDRNLEFDPKRNLFPADFPGSFVNDP